MKKYLVMFALVISGVIAFAQKPTDDFSGKWKTDEGELIVVAKTDSGFVGEPAEKKGLIVLKDVKFVKGKWIATLIKPKDGKTVTCELKLEDGSLKIVARKGMMSKTIIWTKSQL